MFYINVVNTPIEYVENNYCTNDSVVVGIEPVKGQTEEELAYAVENTLSSYCDAMYASFMETGEVSEDFHQMVENALKAAGYTFVIIEPVRTILL